MQGNNLDNPTMDLMKFHDLVDIKPKHAICGYIWEHLGGRDMRRG